MGRIKLRFDGLPHFEKSPLFCTLEPSTEAAFRRLPITYERAIAALRYCRRIGGDKDALGVSEEHSRIMQVAYLRPALMEYVAIEEVLPVDLVIRGLREKPLRILDTDNAMLILLWELQHLQLHLVNILFESTSNSAVVRTRNKDKAFETQLTVLAIPTAHLRQLKTLRNAACFEPEELDAAISWFSRA